MNDGMKEVQLKDGSIQAKALVEIAMYSLISLTEKNGILGVLSFYELVMKCRDSNHQIPENCANHLKQLSLLENNHSVQATIRSIVLSATKGDGMNISLVSPIKGE